MTKLAVVIDEELYEVEIKRPPQTGGSTFEVIVNGDPVMLNIPNWQRCPEDWHWFETGGKCSEIDIDPEMHWIKSPTGLHVIDVSDLTASAPFCPLSRDSRIKAPIPGLVTAVFVQSGQAVKAGEPILILEAMKMENELVAPVAGVVCNLSAAVGQTVQLGEILAEVEQN